MFGFHSTCLLKEIKEQQWYIDMQEISWGAEVQAPNVALPNRNAYRWSHSHWRRHSEKVLPGFRVSEGFSMIRKLAQIKWGFLNGSGFSIDSISMTDST